MECQALYLNSQGKVYMYMYIVCDHMLPQNEYVYKSHKAQNARVTYIIMLTFMYIPLNYYTCT